MRANCLQPSAPWPKTKTSYSTPVQGYWLGDFSAENLEFDCPMSRRYGRIADQSSFLGYACSGSSLSLKLPSMIRIFFLAREHVCDVHSRVRCKPPMAENPCFPAKSGYREISSTPGVMSIMHHCTALLSECIGYAFIEPMVLPNWEPRNTLRDAWMHNNAFPLSSGKCYNVIQASSLHLQRCRRRAIQRC